MNVLTSLLLDDIEESTQMDTDMTYKISQVAENEWKSFALYTLENRAIPNMIDGLKPVQRFYLYSSLKNSLKDFKKVSAVAGIISDYGYNHGESSAASAGQLMAAEWNNNVCLIQGRGSFGTRLVQAAGAARYVYTRVHPNFEEYVMDLDLAPEHEDPEHEPPKFYIPKIPFVLVNGVKGIATGFATDILPRDPEQIKEACLDYIKTGKISKIPSVKFPQFNGTVVFEPVPNKYLCKGTFVRESKTKLLITEVPYGYDREGYIQVLDSLSDSGKIVSYEDLCDKSGFKFSVKLKIAESRKWTDEDIYRIFKLIKTFSENLTVIDENGSLREYDTCTDLIKDFCEFRLGILRKRIELRKSELNDLLRWLLVKQEFILAVLNDQILFKNKKKQEIGEQILKTTSAMATDVDRLLSIQIANLTLELVKKLEQEIQEAKKKLSYWETTDAKKQFMGDLK